MESFHRRLGAFPEKDFSYKPRFESINSEYVRDELKEGEQVLVKVINIDPTGKIRLSRKALLDDAAGGEPPAAAGAGGPGPHGHGHGGHRGGGRPEREGAK